MENFPVNKKIFKILRKHGFMTSQRTSGVIASIDEEVRGVSPVVLVLTGWLQNVMLAVVVSRDKDVGLVTVVIK
jgi:hypothetical protein